MHSCRGDYLPVTEHRSSPNPEAQGASPWDWNFRYCLTILHSAAQALCVPEAPPGSNYLESSPSKCLPSAPGNPDSGSDWLGIADLHRCSQLCWKLLKRHYLENVLCFCGTCDQRQLLLMNWKNRVTGWARDSLKAREATTKWFSVVILPKDAMTTLWEQNQTKKRNNDAMYKLWQLRKHWALRLSFPAFFVYLYVWSGRLPIQCCGLARELHPIQVQLGELHGH